MRAVLARADEAKTNQRNASAAAEGERQGRVGRAKRKPSVLRLECTLGFEVNPDLSARGSPLM